MEYKYHTLPEENKNQLKKLIQGFLYLSQLLEILRLSRYEKGEPQISNDAIAEFFQFLI